MPPLSLTHTQKFLSSVYASRPASRSSPTWRQSMHRKCMEPSMLYLAISAQHRVRNDVNSTAQFADRHCKFAMTECGR